MSQDVTRCHKMSALERLATDSAKLWKILKCGCCCSWFCWKMSKVSSNFANICQRPASPSSLRAASRACNYYGASSLLSQVAVKTYISQEVSWTRVLWQVTCRQARSTLPFSPFFTYSTILQPDQPDQPGESDLLSPLAASLDCPRVLTNNFFWNRFARIAVPWNVWGRGTTSATKPPWQTSNQHPVFTSSLHMLKKIEKQWSNLFGHTKVASNSENRTTVKHWLKLEALRPHRCSCQCMF